MQVPSLFLGSNLPFSEFLHQRAEALISLNYTVLGLGLGFRV